MTKQEIRDVMAQLSNDGANLEVAISQLDMELITGKTPDVEKMLSIQKDMWLWVDSLETRVEDLKDEIKKLPNEQILNVLESENDN